MIELEPSLCGSTHQIGVVAKADEYIDRLTRNKGFLESVLEANKAKYLARKRLAGRVFGDSPEERQAAAIARKELTGRLLP